MCDYTYLSSCGLDLKAKPSTVLSQFFAVCMSLFHCSGNTIFLHVPMRREALSGCGVELGFRLNIVIEPVSCEQAFLEKMV